MKKIYILSLSILMCIGAFAQDRTCGTMTTLENRMEKDPSLKQTHEAYEKATQEWIKDTKTLWFLSSQALKDLPYRQQNRRSDKTCSSQVIIRKNKQKPLKIIPITQQNNRKKEKRAGFCGWIEGRF